MDVVVKTGEYKKLRVYSIDSRAVYERSLIWGTWQTGWTPLTDASGNAVNANSLGGVAAARYAPFLGSSVYESGSMTSNTSKYSPIDGSVTIRVSATTAQRIGIYIDNVERDAFIAPADTSVIAKTLRIKNGQEFHVTGTIQTCYYSIYSNVAQ